VKIAMNQIAELVPLNPITNPNLPIAKYGEAGEGIEKLVTLGISLATIIGAILLLAYFAYGALRIAMSGGDSKATDTGKSAMTNAAVGLLILILLTTIAAIIGKILGINILSPEWSNIFI
jgi:hypothetical protein